VSELRYKGSVLPVSTQQIRGRIRNKNLGMLQLLLFYSTSLIEYRRNPNGWVKRICMLFLMLWDALAILL